MYWQAIKRKRYEVMGFTEVLTIVFIALKLLGVISWSWWLVLLPEIIAFVGYIIILVLSVFGACKANSEIDRWFDNM